MFTLSSFQLAVAECAVVRAELDASWRKLSDDQKVQMNKECNTKIQIKAEIHPPPPTAARGAADASSVSPPVVTIADSDEDSNEDVSIIWVLQYILCATGVNLLPDKGLNVSLVPSLYT